MTEGPEITGAKLLWKTQETDTPPMTLEQIHARGFQSGVRARNLVEYAATLIVVFAFGSYVFTAPNIFIKVGAALTVVGAMFTAWQLHRRGSARTPPASSAQDALAFHRAELERQRQASLSVPKWYLAPFLPGLAVTLIGQGQELEGQPLVAKLVVPALAAVVFVAIALHHRRISRRLQTAIDELDRLKR